MLDIYVSTDGQCVYVWGEVTRRIACYRDRGKGVLRWMMSSLGG